MGARVKVGAIAFAALVLAAACSSCSGSSSSGSDAGGSPGTTAKTAPVVTYNGHVPEDIAAPPADGKGMNVPQPAAPLPAGYVAEEYLIGGTATSYKAGDTPDDGRWTATPGEEAKYRTRVIVRRPASAEAFNGTVLVEWFNVSAIEASPDWAFMSQEMAREGAAYIGVSAQKQGVEGGDTLLEVNADPSKAGVSGVSTDTSGLKKIDPARYGSLAHPGDAYSYDIFGQVGRAVATSPDKLLGALKPKKVIALGESQSAAFLTTYVNAVQPLDPTFDGFLIHSRGAGGAPLDGDLAAARAGSNAATFRRHGVLIRTDVNVPVMMFETETDLSVLGYAFARQPDTDLIRTWEVAGLSHADAHFIRAIVGGPRNPAVGDLLGCENPINIGPQHEVIQAALHHLVEWVNGGPPPPAGTPIELTKDDKAVTITRDEHGIARGGIRHPLVDVPTAVISGEPPGGAAGADPSKGGVCFLFGTTTALDQPTLVKLYGTADTYVDRFTASANKTVAAGFLLQPDADALTAEAGANRALFG